MKNAACLIFFVVGHLLSLSATANICEDSWNIGHANGLSTFQLLKDAYDIGCYGGDRDTDKLTTETKPLIASSKIPEEVDKHKIYIRTQTAAAMEKLHARTTESTGIVKNIEPALKAAKEQLAIDAPLTGATDPQKWQLLGDGRVLVVRELNLKEWANSNCTNFQSCAPAGNLLRLARLGEQVMRFNATPVMQAFQLKYTRRVSQWDAYLNNALPQYQWEWWANGKRMKKQDSRPLDADGDPLGPPTIPNDQLILFHPSVGYEWANLKEGGDEISPSLYLEVVGINRWRWKKDGTMTGGLGGSFIVAVSDHNDADKFSYGAMIHLRNKYSLAATINDGELGFMFGIDFAEFYRDWLNKSKELKEKW